MRVTVQIEIDGCDDHELKEAEIHLRKQIDDLDIDHLESYSEEVPSGAKGAADVAGTIVVGLGNATVLVALIQLIKAWTTRSTGRQAKISDGTRTLEMTGLTTHQQSQIIDSMLKFIDAAETPPDGQE